MARVLVIGGSLGGLFAANLLLRAGHDVQVFERASGSLDGRGAGIVTHDVLMHALLQAGLPSIDDLGVQVQERVILGRSGEVTARKAVSQVLTSWSRLYALLLGLFPAERYTQSTALVDVQQTDAQVTATFSHNGQERTEAADLLIGSDGFRSTVRGLLAPHVQPEYAGYFAWRGVCDEAALSPHTRATLFDYFGFCQPAGEQILGYPVAGPGNAVEPGKRSYNFVWYRPANEAQLQALMTDASGTHHPQGIPPAKVAAPHIAAMRAAGHATLAPQWADVLDQTAKPFLQPIYDVSSEQLAFGRVALLGDAAFVARPHVGMGVTKAAQDALALAAAVQKHGATPQALHTYSQERGKAGQAVVQHARALGARMQTATESSLDADWPLHHVAVAV